jgi:integrase
MIYQRKNSGKYYIRLRDHKGTRRAFAGFRTKAATEDLERRVNDLITCVSAQMRPDRELQAWIAGLPVSLKKKFISWGLITDDGSAKPLAVVRKEKVRGQTRIIPESGHLFDYAEYLRSKGITEKQFNANISCIYSIIRSIKAVSLFDIKPEKVSDYLSLLSSNGRSLRTVNKHLIIFKGFVGWLVKVGRISDNPLNCLAAKNQKKDRRRERRVLSNEEVIAFLDYLLRAEFHHGLTGYERGLLYRLALDTGLRWSEIRKLQRGDFTFDPVCSKVRLRAEVTKNGKECTLPLKSDFAEELSSYFKTTPALPTAMVFSGQWLGKGGAMLQQDLKEARAHWLEETEKGQGKEAKLKAEESPFLAIETYDGVVDFHSLRHTFVTNLANSGVHPSVAQRLARHSSIDLTLGRYTHTSLESMTEAVNRLPVFGNEENIAVRTGTSEADIIDFNPVINTTEYRVSQKCNPKLELNHNLNDSTKAVASSDMQKSGPDLCSQKCNFSETFARRMSVFNGILSDLESDSPERRNGAILLKNVAEIMVSATYIMEPPTRLERVTCGLQSPRQ